MKRSVFVAVAAGAMIAAGAANAQIVPQSPVTVDLVMDAFQSVLVTNCTATVAGTVSGNTLSLATNGVTFAGAGACSAVTMTSDILITYSPTSSSSADVDISNINTTSVLGTCNQGGGSISGTANLSGGGASGAIPGTPTSCTFAVAFANTPAFTSF
ncbi:hypothetical protein D3C77_191920 [compost metagenome]|jgi:hypothetical protein